MIVDIKSRATLMRTAWFYGTFGSGKTRLCATFPRVAWIGAAREGGFETIRYMDPSLFYDGTPPMIFAVSSIEEMMLHLDRDIMPLVKRGVIQTIVIEMSIITDDQVRRDPSDGWTKYGNLEVRMVGLDERWKAIPGLRIVYNSLATKEEDEKKPAGPLMAGRALALKLPPLCDVIAYMHREQEEDGESSYITHLSPYSNYPARHRYGDLLPLFVKNATFRDLEGLLTRKAVADAAGIVTVKEIKLVTLPKLGKL